MQEQAHQFNHMYVNIFITEATLLSLVVQLQEMLRNNAAMVSCDDFLKSYLINLVELAMVLYCSNVGLGGAEFWSVHYDRMSEINVLFVEGRNNSYI